MHPDPDIKDAIVAELDKEDPDWRRIEKVLREKVDSDTSSVRFSVDAAHIGRLGLELVAKQETALAELIKNSYDADATRVVVEFMNHDRIDGTLVLEDDGSGMPVDVVKNAWMRLSTTHKQTNPYSPMFRRLRAGRKGIGRFAVQRLGKRLILETEVSGSDKGLRVTFDWERAFNPGEDLNDVFSSIQTFEKPVSRHGTRLTISGLREKWSESAISRVWRTILLLQDPFDVEQVEGSDDSMQVLSGEDPGFEVALNGITSRKQKMSLGIGSGFLDHALAEISGEITADGTAVARVSSKRLGLEDEMTHAGRFELTGALFFKARYFLYLPDALSGLKLTLAQDMGREYGGIRIYRNGFRVPPYGERTDDWLKLDRDTSRRTLLVPASNVNFFGHVSISKEANPSFEETSSREGLIENDAFEELRSFVRESVEWATKRVAAARGRKQTAGQKDFKSAVRVAKPSEVVDELVPLLLPEKNVEFENSGSPANRAKIANALSDIKQKIVAWEEDVFRREEQSLQYEEMLRILASLGISISVFAHEIRGARSAVAANVEVLSGRVARLPDGAERNGVAEAVESLRSASGRIFDLGGYIAGLMTSTESRALKTLSVKGAVDRFYRQFERYLDRQKIAFEIRVERDDLRTVAMHSSEFDSVLLNFLTNSIKSMKRARVSPRKVSVNVTEADGLIVLSFQDNGMGIPLGVQDRIFDPFFTTAGENDDGIAGPGTGLGLKIVKDIASSYGGSVTVGNPDGDYTCNIEFRVPAASKEKI